MSGSDGVELSVVERCLEGVELTVGTVEGVEMGVVEMECLEGLLLV